MSRKLPPKIYIEKMKVLHSLFNRLAVLGSLLLPWNTSDKLFHSCIRVYFFIIGIQGRRQEFPQTLQSKMAKS